LDIDCVPKLTDRLLFKHTATSRIALMWCLWSRSREKMEREEKKRK